MTYSIFCFSCQINTFPVYDVFCLVENQTVKLKTDKKLWTSFSKVNVVFRTQMKEYRGHPPHIFHQLPPSSALSSPAPGCWGGALRPLITVWQPGKRPLMLDWPFDLELKTQELVLLQHHQHRGTLHTYMHIYTQRNEQKMCSPTYTHVKASDTSLFKTNNQKSKHLTFYFTPRIYRLLTQGCAKRSSLGAEVPVLLSTLTKGVPVNID